MAQILFYERLAALNETTHAGLRILPVSGYGFAAQVNSVTLLAQEFFEAAKEYPIVFVKGSDEVFLPAALLGLRTGRTFSWKRTADGPTTFEDALQASHFRRFEYGTGAEKRDGYASPGLPLWAHADLLGADDGPPAAVGTLAITAPSGYAVVFGDEPATRAGTHEVTYADPPAVRQLSC